MELQLYSLPTRIDTCNKKDIAISNSIVHRSQHNYSVPDMGDSKQKVRVIIQYDTR